MHSRTSKAARAILALALALGLVGALTAPAGAAPKTTVSITKATVGKTLSVAGKLTAGTDGLAAVQVAEDDTGDDVDTALPTGLDIAGATIQANLGAKTLTFAVNLADATPGITMIPGFVINWQLQVDGNDTGQFIQWSNVGAVPPAPPPYIYLCRSTAAEFACDNALDGSLADGVATAVVPFALLGAGPGSVIGQGGAIDGAEAVTTTVGAGGAGFLNNNGGDTAAATDYAIPGGVYVGIAKAGTAAAKVPATILARVSGSSFSATLPKPKKGSYVVVAKTCYGSVCRYATKTVKV